MRLSTATVVALLGAGLVACSGPQPPKEQPSAQLTIVPDIAARRAQFKPMKIEADTSHLSAGDQKALEHLVAAATTMDRIFFEQAWSGNRELAAKVSALTGPLAQPAKDYYRIMFGPWDRLEDFQPFIGDTAHPVGAGFYPEDMTKKEFQDFFASHPDDQKALTSPVTVIRRENGTLVPVPYSKAYHLELEAAATELRAAASTASSETLRNFLHMRAEAFTTNDYTPSDMAWMDVDGPIEMVIGPYETYEDGLFGYKAAFEAFVCVERPDDSKLLAKFSGELPYLKEHLPIPAANRHYTLGSHSPIKVVDEVFTAGDAKAGVQTLAFNLPNDARVREAKGTKKVLLKNMMHAKFDAILTPIAEHVLPAGDAAKVNFDTYFEFILFHELSHGLSPGTIVVDGRSTEPRLELKELYSAIEEAQADVVGVHNIYQLVDKGDIPKALGEGLPWAYTAGLFRAARFGTTEAHGLGVVIQTNYLLDKGAITVTPEGRFAPVPGAFRKVIDELGHDLLMIEATGSYSGAEEMVKQYGTVKPAMQKLLDTLTDIPVDVDPVYQVKGGPLA